MNNSPRISIYIAIIAILVGVAGFAYHIVSQSSITREVSLDDLQSIVTSDFINSRIPTSDTFRNLQGTETGTKYKYLEEELAKMEVDLKNSAGVDTETELLFKRAMYYKKLASVAFTNTSDPIKRKAMMVEAYDGLYDGIFSIAEAAQKDKRNPRYLRRFYVYVINFIYNIDPNSFLDSRFANEPQLKTLIQKYSTDKRIASTLYINDHLFSRDDLPRDNYMVSIKILSLAQLLYRQGVVEDLGLKSKIVDESLELMRIFPTASTTKLTNSKSENDVRPLVDYALGVGILARFDIVTEDQAKQSFDQAYASIAANILSDEDILLFSKVILDVNYAAFLFNANDKVVNHDVSRVLRDIEGFKTKFQYNQEMRRLFTDYIQILKTSGGSRDLARQDMLEIAKQDAQFRDFLSAEGLKI